MTSLIFGTNNHHKVSEIQSIVPAWIKIITLREAGIDVEIPEPHDSLQANAAEKSHAIHKLTQQNCFSEDTGLEIDALHGAPGVLTARYAGPKCRAEDNMKKVLDEMLNITNRSARFRTIISLIMNGEEHLFEGVCEGTITTEPLGDKGFGYDPIFIPDGDHRSFAQMNAAEKNKFSHRKKATDKLISFLQNYGKN